MEICDWSLQLVFNCEQHLQIKSYWLHTTLIVNDNEIWMKEKINEIHLHPLTNHIRIVICN